MPKRTKFRKQMKGRNRGYATRGASLATGEFALKAVEAGRVNSRQIEAARQALTRHVKRQLKFGLGFSLTSHLLKNLYKLVWVKVRQELKSGL